MKTVGFYVNFLLTPGFEVYRGDSAARLDFYADGSTAVLTASQDYRAVTIQGDALDEDYLFEVDFDVEVEPNGTIRLEDLAGETVLVGFAQQGGDAMILGNVFNNDDFYELGLMILREE
jgi:hypothetical protein